MRLSAAEALRKLGGRFPLLLYLGAIVLLSAVITGGLLATAHAGGLHGWALGLMGMVSLLCASHLAVALVNWLATLLAPPHLLPRMDFSKGIPPESRTLAVVPTMLTRATNLEELIEALEVRFLANRDDNLHLGLLTDFPDAGQESLPEDGPLLRLARQKIEQLNDKYPGKNSGHILPVSSAAPLESSRADVDGIRAQAGQAWRFKCTFAGRLRHPLLPGRGRHPGSFQREVRHHPRHRHAVTARLGLAVCGGDGAPAESCALRSRPAACGGRLWHFATTSCRELAWHKSLAVCADVGE